MATTIDTDRMINVSRLKRWRPWHETIPFQTVHSLVDVWNVKPRQASFDNYNEATLALQRLIQQAIDEDVECRGLGGGWSLSPVAVTSGILINTKPLNYRFQLTNLAHSEYEAQGGDPTNLFFVQCGNAISEINEVLASVKKSLQTSGASNGQTIIGAMSTGTHGAALDVGSVPDFVRALHIVVSPARHVWLEGKPTVRDSLPRALGAEVIRDEGLFNAALVSFGSFGIIHGAVLEAEAEFYLNAWRRRMAIDEGLWKAMEHLDFSDADLPRKPERPYHFQVVINPHDTEHVFVTVMYKDRQRRPGSNPPRAGSRIVQGDNALEVIGTITDMLTGDAGDWAIERLVDLVERFYGDYENVSGTLGEIFTDVTTRGKAYSTAMGVPLGRVREAVEIVLRQNADLAFPGLISLRYVKASKATLAFTSHEERTCVFELDAPGSRRALAFYRRIWKGFEEARIPYTLHWGKMSELTADDVRRMYGAKVDAWLNARRLLLDTPKLRKIFSNQFVRQVGLDT